MAGAGEAAGQCTTVSVTSRVTNLSIASKPKHRSSTGNPDHFDLESAAAFSLLTALGLREFHFVLEMRCGALGLARLLIPYLLAGRYFGVEQEQWLLEEGIQKEIGHDQLDLKKPRFLINPASSGFGFGVKFDYAVGSFDGPEMRTGLEGSASWLQKHGLFVASSQEPEKLQAVGKTVGLESAAIDWPHPTTKTWILFFRPGGAPRFDLLYRFRANDIGHLSELKIVSNVNCGFVEGISKEGSCLSIFGWAIHPETGRAATHVLAADNLGRIIAKTRVGIPREDVASVYGGEALPSGFRLNVTNFAADEFGSVLCLSMTGGERKAFALQVALQT